MKNRFSLLCLLLLLGVNTFSQNLVPNWSFEQYSQCPFAYSQMDFASGWNKSYVDNANCCNYHVEYMNACGTPNFQVPSNVWGYQPASTGVAYMCQVTMDLFVGPNYRENMWAKLISPLIIGETYYITMRVCQTNVSQYSSNNEGIKFSTDTTMAVNNIAAIHSTAIITDSVNWTTISGCFKADSAYTYIGVGNFYDDAHTNSIQSCPSCIHNHWGYYVDDISVIPISISGQGTVCNGGSTVIKATGGTSYLWSTGATTDFITVSPTSTTTYSVQIINPSCTIDTSFTVNAGAPGNLNIAVSNPSICAGNFVTLTANETSGSSGTFTWQPGGSHYASITVSPDVTTTYTVQDSNGCGTASANTTIFVNPTPVPSFTAAVTQGCAPFCVQFTDLSTGNIVGWNWVFGDGDTSTIQNPIYCYPKPGVYTPVLTVTSDSGCSATLKILQMISVFSKPVANFTYSPQPVSIIEPTVQFTDKSTDVYGIAYWFWSFGDGTKEASYSSSENPSHIYRDTGTYCAQLVVMNVNGCTDTAVDCIDINPIFTLYIPSAFSPNGDGINDIFAVKGEFIKSFEMYIFDRWGMEIFHSTDITKGWNGKVNGGSILSQEDTYVYIINATDYRGNKHHYMGEVSLIK